MSDLVICKLSHSNASVAGGMEMILLCEKVAKEDIQVRFFEEKEGQVIWEGFGDFQPVHVHKQVCTMFNVCVECCIYYTSSLNLNLIYVNRQQLHSKHPHIACSK